MKKMNRVVSVRTLGVAILTTTFVVSSCFIVFADGIQRTITATFNSVDVFVNGEELEDDNLMYKGTVYLPLRKVGEAVDAEVGFDAKTSSVTLNTKTTTEEVAKNIVEAEIKVPSSFDTGMYTVGKDISAGIYRVTLEGDSGFVARYNAVNPETENTIGAHIYENDGGYIEILDTDRAVEVDQAMIEKIDVSKLPKSQTSTFTDGMYLVGTDMKTGLYRIEPTSDEDEYYVGKFKDATFDMERISENFRYFGDTNDYVNVTDNDYVVVIRNGRLVRED